MGNQCENSCYTDGTDKFDRADNMFAEKRKNYLPKQPVFDPNQYAKIDRGAIKVNINVKPHKKEENTDSIKLQQTSIVKSNENRKDNKAVPETRTRKDLVKTFQMPLLDEASPRVDQRKGTTWNITQSSDQNMMMKALEKKVIQQILQALDKQNVKFSFSASAMVNERKNPIEITYEVLETIGKGGYGEVKKIRHKELNVIRALKILKKSNYNNKSELAKLRNEINVMKMVDHPNIVKLFEFYEDANTFFIVTEFVEGGPLLQYIQKQKNFSENVAAKILTQLLSAINHCHMNKVVHRDIKPENILVEPTQNFKGEVDNWNIKIIDFGISCKFDPNKKLTVGIGTPYYVAPEVIQQDYNEKVDIWSCGVILYILLCGHPPFMGKTNQEIFMKIIKASYTFNSKEWTSVSKGAKDFIKKLLQKHANNRPSAEQALKDPWLKAFVSRQHIEKPICVDALTNLRNFHCERSLEQAVIAYIANAMMTKEQERKLNEIFSKLDLNNDGTLTIEELETGFSYYLEDDYMSPYDFQLILTKVDTNSNGLIEYSEFITAACQHQQHLTDTKLKLAYDMFDLDGNGEITPFELKSILNPGKEDVEESEWERVISEFDTNKNGSLNFLEFKNMMLKVHQNEMGLSSLLQPPKK